MANDGRSRPLSSEQKEERNARDWVRTNLERLNPQRSHGIHGEATPSIGRTFDEIWQDVKERRQQRGDSWVDIRNSYSHIVTNNQRYRRGEEFTDDYEDDLLDEYPEEMYWYHEF